jgi:hypothetical protein
MAGVVILAGHYIDFFNMMPGTVGDRWFIVPEIASVLFFLGLFIFVVFTALTKNPLLPKEILTLKRVNIFIINIKEKKTDDKFVGNYSFSFMLLLLYGN